MDADDVRLSDGSSSDGEDAAVLSSVPQKVQKMVKAPPLGTVRRFISIATVAFTVLWAFLCLALAKPFVLSEFLALEDVAGCTLTEQDIAAFLVALDDEDADAWEALELVEEDARESFLMALEDGDEYACIDLEAILTEDDSPIALAAARSRTELVSAVPCGTAQIEDDTHEAAHAAFAHPRPVLFSVETLQDDPFRASAARHFSGAPWRSVFAFFCLLGLCP